MGESLWRRPPRLPRPRPGGLLRPAQGAHRLQATSTPTSKGRRTTSHGCSGPSPPAACVTCSPTRATTCCHNEALDHRLRPAAAWSRSFAPPPRWSAPRRCGPPPPRTPSRGCWWWTRCGASCSTPKARPSWSRWRSGRSKHRLGFQFITQDVQDLLSRGHLTDHHRTLRARPATERRLQAALAAGRRRHQHGGRRLRPARRPATLAAVLPAVETGCSWPRGNRFPVRIEATPEGDGSNRVETGQALGPAHSLDYPNL